MLFLLYLWYMRMNYAKNYLLKDAYNLTFWIYNPNYAINILQLNNLFIYQPLYNIFVTVKVIVKSYVKVIIKVVKRKKRRAKKENIYHLMIRIKVLKQKKWRIHPDHNKSA